MADWGKRVFLGALLGAAFGAIVGFVVARTLWTAPQATPEPSPSPAPITTQTEVPPTLTTSAQADEASDGAIVVVAALYALDGDLARARERLATLDLDDPAAEVAKLALHHAEAGNHQLATDLATLAAALGSEEGQLLAYVATPTPTATHTATPSPTPTATPTPTTTPTATPTDTPSPTATRRPAAPKPPTATPPPPLPTPLELEWDTRASVLDPPVKLVKAEVGPGQTYWRLVRMEWRKAGEGGNTLLYISTLDEYGRAVFGQPVIVEHGPQ
jgi:hypothetical protein